MICNLHETQTFSKIIEYIWYFGAFFQSKQDVANKVKYLLASWLPFIENISLTTLLVSVTIKQLAFET